MNKFDSATIGRTLSGTFQIMRENNIPFRASVVENKLLAEIPGFFCPEYQKFSPGTNKCAFDRKHK